MFFDVIVLCLPICGMKTSYDNARNARNRTSDGSDTRWLARLSLPSLRAPPAPSPMRRRPHPPRRPPHSGVLPHRELQRPQIRRPSPPHRQDPWSTSKILEGGVTVLQGSRWLPHPGGHGAPRTRLCLAAVAAAAMATAWLMERRGDRSVQR
jgi:hypothetical protein